MLRARSTLARSTRNERSATSPTTRPSRTFDGSCAAYEHIVRRYPTSGYCDNALWQAANLAILAADRFGEDVDRRTAQRLLKALTTGYPSSSLVRQAQQTLQDLDHESGPAVAERAPRPIRAADPPAAAAARDAEGSDHRRASSRRRRSGEAVSERDPPDDASRRRADHARPWIRGRLSPGRSRPASSRLLRSEERPFGQQPPGCDVEVRRRRGEGDPAGTSSAEHGARGAQPRRRRELFGVLVYRPVPAGRRRDARAGGQAAAAAVPLVASLPAPQPTRNEGPPPGPTSRPPSAVPTSARQRRSRRARTREADSVERPRLPCPCGARRRRPSRRPPRRRPTRTANSRCRASSG